MKGGVFGLRPVTAAAVAAAQIALVQEHVLRGDPGQHGSVLERPLRLLVANPHVDPVIADQHRGVARLHASAAHVWDRIGRLDHVGCLPQSGLDVARFDNRLARLAQLREVPLEQGG